MILRTPILLLGATVASIALAVRPGALPPHSSDSVTGSLPAATAHPSGSVTGNLPAATTQSSGAGVETLELAEELDSRGRIGGIAVDRQGFVYVSNFLDAVWRIAPDGSVRTLSRDLNGSSGVAVAPGGDVLVANFFDHTINEITPAGEVTTLVDRGLVAPVGLAVDGAGELFVCNCGNDTIARVAADGTVATFASGELLACPNGITFDDRGDLYVVNFNNDHVVRVDRTGEASILATLPGVEPAPGNGREADEVTRPAGNAHVAFARGALFVTRIRTHEIYRVSVDGEVEPFAGTGEPGIEDGPAPSATLAHPNGIATGPDGDTLWFNDLVGQWRGNERTSIVVRKLRLGAGDGGGERSAGDEETLASTPTSTSIRVGELTFDALVAGPDDGEPVILLHGFPETSYAFRRQLGALADAGFRAVAPDQRGYSPGARPTAIADYSMRHLVGDVIGIAGALGFESFHLVGHDWGGAVAWVLAATFPQRVRTLAVLSTPHVSAFGRALADPDDDQAERSAYFESFSAEDAEERFLRDDAAYLRRILAGLDEDAVDVYVKALDTPEAIGAALNWYRASALRGSRTEAASLPPPDLTITVPTLYVWGTEDVAFGRGAAEATREFVDGPYRFEAVEGSGHWLMERATALVNELLVDHLRGGTTTVSGRRSP